VTTRVDATTEATRVVGAHALFIASTIALIICAMKVRLTYGAGVPTSSTNRGIIEYL